MTGGPRRTLYVVQRLNWIYNDSFVEYRSDRDEYLKAFSDRARAEAYRLQLIEESRDEAREWAGRGGSYFDFEVIEIEADVGTDG